MDIPQNSRVLYRILSEKSRLGFGKYADLTVRDVLKINPPYIVWLYYRQSNISLRPELIEELDIIPIAKPGTNEDMYWEWRDNREQKFSEEEKSPFGVGSSARRKGACGLPLWRRVFQKHNYKR